MFAIYTECLKTGSRTKRVVGSFIEALSCIEGVMGVVSEEWDDGSITWVVPKKAIRYYIQNCALLDIIQ